MKERLYLAGVALVVSALGLSLLSGFAGEPTGMIISGPGAQKNQAVLEPRVVLEPAVAGSFYPGDAAQLESMIGGFLSEANPPEIPVPRGLVVPHAGYVYSGLTAAHGFKALEGHEYNTVIVLGPSHHFLFEGAAVPNATHYRTPLGGVRISPEAGRLADGGLIFQASSVFEPEHSVEAELPFLQAVLGDFELIPVVTGRADPRALAERLLPIIDDRTLVVASSDLSHYHPYEEAVSLDRLCTEAIPNLDLQGVADDCEACGRIPILALMHIARERGWSGRLMDYRNSGDTAGTKGSVVGYASVAFWGEA
jgi:AmmeMemoRadiSam system protein B